MRRTLPGLALLLLAVCLAHPLRAAKDDPAAQLAAAQAKLQQEDPQAALAIVEPLIRKQPKLAEAYRLRANARFMLDTPGGKEDLDRALQLDPTLRQAWLDRAGVAVAEKRYDAALADLQKAHDLAPADPDGTLNIGVVQLLMGKLDDASRSFETYLGLKPRDAQAQYMVARNYALAGYAGLAVQHLQQAVALDEKMRAAARGDANFTDLQANARFQQLLAVDAYQLPAGGHKASRTFPGANYQAGKGPLLPATMDAMQLLGEPLLPQVEVTPDWALLWGAMRIKLADAREASTVEITAPPEAMTAAEFQQRSSRLLETILVQVSKRKAAHRPLPAATPQP